MAINYDTLLSRLLKRRRISKREHAAYQADLDRLADKVNNGTEMLCLAWDGDFPGNSGSIWVSRWKGFFFCSSSDYSPEGPFESLDDALGIDWFYTDTANPELSSSSLPVRKLLSIARGLVSEEGGCIHINQTPYELRGKKLWRVRSRAPRPRPSGKNKSPDLAGAQ